MKKNNWGGSRTGAGRTPLEEDQRKQGVKIYIAADVKEDVLKYGTGNNFSEKAVDLIQSELLRRKSSDTSGN
jgi:hypothetical protein